MRPLRHPFETRGRTGGGSRAASGGTNAATTSPPGLWFASWPESQLSSTLLASLAYPFMIMPPCPSSISAPTPSPDRLAAMRRAMAEAEVGDDVFLEDPTLNRLQDRAAAVFGREAALFVPSGSMGNLACVMAQTQPGQEVICETNGHIYNYEMGALSALAGVLPRVVNGEDGLLSWDVIAPAIRPQVYYRPRTSLICLENTVNMAGGTVYRDTSSTRSASARTNRGFMCISTALASSMPQHT